MKLVNVAAAILNTTPLDWDGNQRTILAAIDNARRQAASVRCPPETCLCGYGCEDAFHASVVTTTAWKMLQDILPSTRGMVVSFGLPILFRNGLFNCAAVVVDGHVVGLVAQRFLAGDGIHYEPRWFTPWPADVVAHVEIDGQSHPIGDLPFDLGGVKIGFEICEDAWVANRPGGDLAREGVRELKELPARLQDGGAA